MLYDEFIEGTGCRVTDYNYKVYKDLEVMYMNSNLSKQEIYEYGKKLVDNSLTEKQKQWNADIDAEVNCLKMQLEDRKNDLKWYTDKTLKPSIKWAKNDINRIRNKIRNLKTCKYV